MLTWRKALLVLGASFPVLAGAQWQPVLRNVPAIVSDRDGEHEQRPTASVKDGFTFAAGGDLLGPYSGRLLVEDPQIAPVAKIFQGADAGFANLEGNLFDSAIFTGYPAAENGGFEQGGVGSGPVLPKALATELKRAGITMLSTANNHFARLGRRWHARHACESRRGENRARGKRPQPVSGPCCRPTRDGKGHGGLDRGRLDIHAHGAGRCRVWRWPPIQGATSGDRGIAQPADRARDRIRARSAPGNRPTTGQDRGVRRPRGHTCTERGGVHSAIVPAVRSYGHDLRAAVRRSRGNSEGDSRGQTAGRCCRLFDPRSRNCQRWAGVRCRARNVGVCGLHAQAVPRCGRRGRGRRGDSRTSCLARHRDLQGLPDFYGLGSLFFQLGADWRREWFDSVVAVSEFRSGKVAEVRLYPIVLGTPEEKRTRLDQGMPRLAHGPPMRNASSRTCNGNRNRTGRRSASRMTSASFGWGLNSDSIPNARRKDVA